VRVEKLLTRLKREFIKVNILQACLDTIIFFLTSNLILFLFSLQLVSGTSNIKSLTILSTVFFLFNITYRTKNYRLEIYEEKNPELKEVLRTARDNVKKSNIASQALFDELIKRSRSVTSESIIPSKKIVKKSIAVGILSLITVTSGIVNFNITENGGEILPEIDRLEEIVQGENGGEFELNNDTDIFGEPRDMNNTGTPVEFNITGEGESSEAEPSINTDEQEEMFVDNSNPDEVEDIELAKKYMIEIRELE